MRVLMGYNSDNFQFIENRVDSLIPQQVWFAISDQAWIDLIVNIVFKFKWAAFGSDSDLPQFSMAVGE